MARFIHMADLHLGAPLTFIEDESKREARRQDLFNAFARATDYALCPENSIDGVIIAGDLFDSPNPPATLVGQTEALLRKLDDARIPVILTPGTHDSALHPASVYRRHSFPGVIMLSDPNPKKPREIIIKDQPCYFYGFDYNPLKTKMPPEIERVCSDGVHIGVLHCSLMLKSHWQAGEAHVPIKPDQMEKWRMDYLALGHYHNFSIHHFGNTTAVYPGTLEGRKFSEEGPRFLAVAEISEGNKPQVEKIPWNRRTLINAVIDLNREGAESNKDIIQAAETYKGAPDEVLLNLKLTGSREFSMDADIIRGRLKESFFYLQLTDNTSFLNSSAIRALSREKSVRGIFAGKILEKLSGARGAEKDIYSYALSAALEKMRGGESFEV